MQILKTWNIRLMESIAFNPHQLNQISSVLNTNTLPADTKKGKSRMAGSKSFRNGKSTSLKRDQQDLRRSDSFSKLQGYRTSIGGVPSVVGGGTALSQGSVIRVGGLPPLPREANTRSWGGGEDLSGGMNGNLSQDSFFVHSTGLGGSPPPLPPRPHPSHMIRKYDPDDDKEDPDYAYIKEDEVQGPKNANTNVVNANANAANANTGKQRPSITVDDVLNELEQDIIRENRVKKEEEQRRRVQNTLGGRSPRHQQKTPPPLSLGPRVKFPKAEPQDYTDFVPSKQRSQTKSTSSEPEKTNIAPSHARSASEPDPRPLHSPSRLLSQPPPVFEGNEEAELPQYSLSDHAPTDYSEFHPDGAPALPPRTWRHASTSSSHTSSGSTGNLGNNDLTRSLSGSVFGAAGGEGGMATPGGGGGGVSPTSEGARLSGLSDEGGAEGVVDTVVVGRVQGKRTTPSLTSDNKDGKAPPPSTIPEEPAAQPTNSNEVVGGAAPETGDTKGPATPPPLPPRSPTKEKLSRKSSSSSMSSVSSGGRCPRCRNHKAKASKTVSLGTHSSHIHSPSSHARVTGDDCRKSLPDLADPKSAPPENSLGGGGGGGRGHRHGSSSHRDHHHHCNKCSPASSTDTLQGGGVTSNGSGEGGAGNQRSSSLQNFEYLQLVGDTEKDVSTHSSSSTEIENELRPEMDLLNSCLKSLEYMYLEQKANNAASATSNSAASTMTSAVSNSTPSTSSIPASSAPSSHWTAAGMKGRGPAPQGDTAAARKAVYTQAKRETQQVLADLSQPLGMPGKATPITTASVPISSSSFSTISSTKPSFSSDAKLPLTNGLLPHMGGKQSVGVANPSSSPSASSRVSRRPSEPLPQQRSSSSIGGVFTTAQGHLPPVVPPRSMVSLAGHSEPGISNSTHNHAHNHARISQHKNQSRSATQLFQIATPTTTSTKSRPNSMGPHHHQLPTRSSSSFAVHHPPHTQTMPTRTHPSLMRHQPMNHMESPGSTVFIHHIKDSRVGGLTHFV